MKAKENELRDLQITAVQNAANASAVICDDRNKVDETSLEALNAVSLGFLIRNSARIRHGCREDIEWSRFLNPLEEICAFREDNLQVVRPLLSGLWEKETSENSHRPEKPNQLPKGWKYMPVAEAVKKLRRIFGASLKANSVLKLAAKPLPENSQGFLTSIKLTKLARIFRIRGNPLENTERGREAYRTTLTAFQKTMKKAYRKAKGGFNFYGMTSSGPGYGNLILTAAGRKAWQELEAQSDDDFIVAPADAGSLYGGYSYRHARLSVLKSGDQMPQDCIMTGTSVMLQPDLLSKGHIFSSGNCSCFHAGEYRFGFYWNLREPGRVCIDLDNNELAMNFHSFPILFRR